jgi:GntR family transcriptional regulator
VDVLRQNGIPFYHQLKEIFTEKIQNGEWKPGETIPNEVTLCQQYGVSRGPVRQALDHLVREGMLKRKQGKGTIVLPPKVENNLGDFFSFTSLIQKRGMRPGVHLLYFDTIPATGSIAHALKLDQGKYCFKILRLRLADNEPLILETVYVPEQICRGLTEDQVSSRSLYEILASDYGAISQSVKQFFEPAIADEYEAKELNIAKGAPVLLIQNTTFAADYRPLVFSKAIMRGDRVRYFVEINGVFFDGIITSTISPSPTE